MPTHYWIKLYHEILQDPKMGRLPDRTWRRCIELFLLAGDHSQNGELPPVNDIVWLLRVDKDELLEDLNILESLDIVMLKDDDVTWVVTHFAERQDPDTNAERLQRYRERKQAGNVVETQMKRNVSHDVTIPVPDKDKDKDKDIDKDKEQESDKEQETDKKPSSFLVVENPFSVYESELFGAITPAIRDELGDLIDTYSEVDVVDALKAASLANKKNMPYVHGILKNWKASGKGTPKPGKNGDYRRFAAWDDNDGDVDAFGLCAHCHTSPCTCEVEVEK